MTLKHSLQVGLSHFGSLHHVTQSQCFGDCPKLNTVNIGEAIDNPLQNLVEIAFAY